jgi:prolyl-tRNA editing enzyme YbaK/EbsC (Cys-tRNA(Pro) deacylase)
MTEAMLHPTAAKVQRRLHELGLDVEVRVLPDSTRTAAEAAKACRCELGQIVKSLVFADDDGPLMCLWAGDRQVPTEQLGLRRADADTVREVTGFAVGGVPPLGHDSELRTIVDASLRRFGRVWCAAGTPNAVFEVETATLLDAVARLAETRIEEESPE